MSKHPKKAEYICENPECRVISVKVARHYMRVLRETSS
jgi:hypothetical protein